MSTRQEDLTKITIVTILGLSILLFGLFWLKGYKLNGRSKITVYFKDVSGLEEGAIVRWSGLRVGVVESVKPVVGLKKDNKNSFKQKKEELLKLSNAKSNEIKELEAKQAVTKDPTEKEKITEKISKLKEVQEVYHRQAEALEDQILKYSGSSVEVNLILTKEGVPLGPVSRVSIVPSGLLGEHYVEITSIIHNKSAFEGLEPVFVTGEPLRFERFMKANIESSEAFRDAVTKINELLSKDDIELLRATVRDSRRVVQDVNRLIDNASILLSTTSSKLEQLATSSNLLSKSVVEVGENINKIIGDPDLINNLKSTASSINLITKEISSLLGEEGVTNDIVKITQSAKDTSLEIADFIRDLRKTNEELELPKTVANLNSLAEKLDTLTSELNTVVTDEKFKEDIKITIQKARETSENLEKISKKFNKRFLLFRLLF